MAEVSVSTGRGWNPAQYDRFRNERQQPFFDLAALVQPQEGMRIVDLGCGPGDLTAWLHGELGASETVGIDHSDAMLASAATHEGNGVRFEKMDVLDAPKRYPGQFDLVFSNAALQWVLGHETLFPLIAGLAKPGGQIAVQMPANSNHVSHRTAHVVAAEEPFRTALGGWLREDPVRTDPEFYATLFHDVLGCTEQHVRMQVYGHTLASTRAIVEWVKGSLLTAYISRLPEDLHAPFLARYETLLLERAGEHAPFFYPFPRVLIWGRLPA